MECWFSDGDGQAVVTDAERALCLLPLRRGLCGPGPRWPRGLRLSADLTGFLDKIQGQQGKS